MKPPRMVWLDSHRVIIYSIIIAISAFFIGVVMDRIYYKSAFNKEMIIKVQPKGIRHQPYYPYAHYETNLDYQDFKLIIRNGNVVRAEFLKYSWE